MAARRGRGEGAIYRRASDGKWVAVVDLGYSGGKRQRKNIYGRTRREAAAKLQKAQADLLRGALVTGSPTVEQWMCYWLDHVAVDRVRATTLRGYLTKVERYIIPHLGRHRLDRLEPKHVRAMYADMAKACPDPGEDGRCPHTDPTHPLAQATIRQTHAILRRALTVAVREGRAPRNVCDSSVMDPPSAGRVRRKPLSVAQARKVLAKAEGRMRSRYHAALLLGIRQGEALQLHWENVDLDDSLIWVTETIHGKPKSAASTRAIPVPPFVMAELRKRWVEYLTERAADGYEDHGLVWSQPNGRPVGPRADWGRWRDLLVKAGVPHVALHAARNTTASLLSAAGVPPRIISEILGHSTVQITQDIYTAGDLEQRQAAMLALEAYVAEPEG